MSEDAIVPVDKLVEYHADPPQGWRKTVVRIDPAFSAKDTADRACLAVASLGHDGARRLNRRPEA